MTRVNGCAAFHFMPSAVCKPEAFAAATWKLFDVACCALRKSSTAPLLAAGSVETVTNSIGRPLPAYIWKVVWSGSNWARLAGLPVLQKLTTRVFVDDEFWRRVRR